jgi:hypothetical protein
MSGMICEELEWALMELARRGPISAEDRAACVAHLDVCEVCGIVFEGQVRLSAAAGALAAEAGQFTAPATVEQALIIELRSAGRFQRRRFVYGAMGGAIAASLALALWMTWRPAPKVAVKQKPSVPTVSEPIVAAVPVRVITTRRPRTVHALAVQEQPFIAIPYTPPIEPYERTEVMRMDLPVTALIAAGLPMNMADPGEIVQTDVLVGQDGRARAVRLISMSDLN